MVSELLLSVIIPTVFEVEADNEYSRDSRRKKH